MLSQPIEDHTSVHADVLFRVFMDQGMNKLGDGAASSGRSCPGSLTKPGDESSHWTKLDIRKDRLMARRLGGCLRIRIRRAPVCDTIAEVEVLIWTKGES